MGPDFDESKLVKMPEGSFFVLEPGMQHFVQAAEEAVVQLNAIGPWGNHLRPRVRRSSQPAAGAEGASRGGREQEAVTHRRTRRGGPPPELHVEARARLVVASRIG